MKSKSAPSVFTKAFFTGIQLHVQFIKCAGKRFLAITPAVLVLATLVLTNPRAVAESQLTLVEAGKSVAPIIVFPDAPPRTMEAVMDLAAYMEKVTGARPEIIVGMPEKTPEHAIWVGYQAVLKELFPKVGFDFSHPEEILIAANENHLVIAGRDRWKKDQMEMLAARGGDSVKGIQQEYGTANAIYTFIQQYLNVRWMWPGELGEDIVKQSELAFAPFEYHYHPQFLARAGLLRMSALGDDRGKAHTWARYQRLQLDSLQYNGGHAFTTWWDKYYESHPEYFALQPDGTRGVYPYPDARKTKECVSNPTVWDRWLADTAEVLAQDPLRTTFEGSCPDSWASGHCVCENCVAWDDPDGKKFTYNWKGVEKEGVALTDRHVTFWNHLAHKLKERFPEEKIFVTGMAYGSSRPAPLGVVPDKNVIVGGVFNTFSQPDNLRQEAMKDFAAWGKLSPIVWRPNVWVVVGALGLPEFSLKETIENFQFAAQHHAVGVFFDTTWEHWATMGPEYYLMAQLAWNPGQDAEAVIVDYYSRGFGPAAAEIREYWDGLKAAWRTAMESVPTNPIHGRIKFGENLEIFVGQIYTPEFFAKSEAILQRAMEKLANEPEIYRKRVEFVHAGLTATRLIFDDLVWMQKVVKSNGKDADALANAKDGWQEIVRLSEKHPYALNLESINRAMRVRIFKKGKYFTYMPALGEKASGKRRPASEQQDDMD